MADRRRTGLSALATLVLALGSAACGAIPNGGPVHFGRDVSQGGGALNDSDIHVLPPAPVPGEGPAEIVKGFLRASANFDDDHAIARRYLTPRASATWRPNAGITVYDPVHPDPAPVGPSTPGRGQTVVLQANRIATIDVDGEYAVRPGRLAQPFQLTRHGSDWRISAVPSGLLLSSTDLQRDLRSVYTYFLDPTSRVVVPDHVFLQTSSRGQPTALVRALLRGPTGWLRPAVTTAFPAGTALIGNVPLSGTVVTVNLTAAAAQSSSAARAAMSAQLVWTLRQLPDVTGVRIQVDGNPLAVPGEDDVQQITDWSSFNPDPHPTGSPFYFVSGGTLRGSDGAEVPGPLGHSLPLEHPAITGDDVAGLRTTGGTTSLYAGPLTGVPSGRLSAPRGTLTPPSVDGWGGVWTVHRGASPAVLWLPPSASRPVSVPAAALFSLGSVSELRVSRDGTRVAAIVGADPLRRLVVGRVVLNRAGQPTLDGFRLVAPGLRDAVSLSWASSDQIAALARPSSTGPRSPWLIEVDGSAATSTDTVGLPPAGPQLLAAGGSNSLVVAAAGTIYRTTGGAWTPVGAGTDPAWAN